MMEEADNETHADQDGMNAMIDAFESPFYYLTMLLAED